MTLDAIAHEFGLTRERVRQIINDGGGVTYERSCHSCGSTFKTKSTRQMICGDCRCATCGKKLTKMQAQKGTRYCIPSHDPDYKDSASGATYRVIERGIYVRVYRSTGIRVNDLFYVSSVHDGWHTFELLADARIYRDGDARRTDESTVVRAAILRALEDGPARTDQLAELIGMDSNKVGLYVKHMKADGLIRTLRTERIQRNQRNFVDRPVWELVSHRKEKNERRNKG